MVLSMRQNLNQDLLRQQAGLELGQSLKGIKGPTERFSNCPILNSIDPNKKVLVSNEPAEPKWFRRSLTWSNFQW